jgi:PKD repeat protein
MRSIHRNLCYTAALLVVAAACGGDGNGGGGGNGNEDPVADFTVNCDALACTFTDASTDPDGEDTIESWSWDFGGDGAADVQNPTHTFSAAGTYDVTLTVTDADGATNSATGPVQVTTTPNVAPTAAFDFVCNAGECTFTDQSSDTDGTIASYAWDFGDTETSTDADPVHTYAGITELTDFEVTLTVTDDDGATGTITQTVAVAPPAQTTCDDGSGNQVECGLTLTDAATVRVTITGRDCTADGNTLVITEPDDPDTVVFDDGCSLNVGDFFDLNGGTAYAAGTELRAQMISGSDDPDRIAPALQVTGTYPEWTLSFDDGEDPTGPGEPDFNDIIMTVTATP